MPRWLEGALVPTLERVLKSEIEIAPVYHRKPERIRAHALICFLALVLGSERHQRIALPRGARSIL